MFIFYRVWFFIIVSVGSAGAWDGVGHGAVNELALAALPADFPNFVRSPAAAQRIIYLASEADRWRNAEDLTFKHCNEPEHYFDFEYLAGFGMSLDDLTPFRYDFVAQLAVYRSQHPEVEPQVDPERDEKKLYSFFGFLPWAINENYSKLTSLFSTLKYLLKIELNNRNRAKVTQQIVDTQENIIYVMGVMGHYAGDCSQPLHLSKHHHGWVGDNPNNYTTNTEFHSWIDGGYIQKIGGLDMAAMRAEMRPAALLPGANRRNLGAFANVTKFIKEQSKYIEPLYVLEKGGRLSAEGSRGLEGRDFIQKRLVDGAQLLADLWLTAWQKAPVWQPYQEWKKNPVEKKKSEEVKD